MLKAYSKRTRRVAGSRPSSTAVQTHSFIGDDLEQTTATEGFGVGLALDFEHVEGQEDDFTDSDDTISVSANQSDSRETRRTFRR